MYAQLDIILYAKFPYPLLLPPTLYAQLDNLYANPVCQLVCQVQCNPQNQPWCKLVIKFDYNYASTHLQIISNFFKAFQLFLQTTFSTLFKPFQPLFFQKTFICRPWKSLSINFLSFSKKSGENVKKTKTASKYATLFCNIFKICIFLSILLPFSCFKK